MDGVARNKMSHDNVDRLKVIETFEGLKKEEETFDGRLDTMSWAGQFLFFAVAALQPSIRLTVDCDMESMPYSFSVLNSPLPKPLSPNPCSPPPFPPPQNRPTARLTRKSHKVAQRAFHSIQAMDAAS